MTGVQIIYVDDEVTEDTRIRVYTLTVDGVNEPTDDDLNRIADVSLDGLGSCLQTLREERQILNDDRVGIRDRQLRRWLVNPWAVGTASRSRA